MASENVTITLSADQAIVLSAWLDRCMATPVFAAAVDDRAVWSSLLRISGSLDEQLVEIFHESYDTALDEARARLIAKLGDFGA